MEACAQAGTQGLDPHGLDPHGTVTELARTLLAEKGRLRGDAARLQCHPLKRGDTLCGLFFALRGPREVLLTAVWDAATGMLWCYDSRGERFNQVEAGLGDSAESV